MTHVTCRLTAMYRDQLRNPKLGNRVWATFFLLSDTFDHKWLVYTKWLTRGSTGAVTLATNAPIVG